LWAFKAEQKRFKIGKVNIGGLPGANPTVLIGSIFYHDFNKEAAEECINIQEEFSDKTGNPHMLPVAYSAGIEKPLIDTCIISRVLLCSFHERRPYQFAIAVK